MSRRLTAAAALAVLGVAMLPALPAFASAASSASITGVRDVYPGANSFSITVTNNEAPLSGKAINAIRVNFPVVEAGIRLGANAGTAQGFTGTSTNLGDTQFITYRGGTVLPGQPVVLTFPATVGSPIARDLLGDFRVQVSSDDFRTNKNATTTPGGLTAKVQVLEVLQEGLKPTAPAGTTDRSGTAGQTVTYASTVRNHAQTALSVSTSLTSNGGDSATAQTISVPGNRGEATASIPLVLAQGSADRVATLTTSATAANAVAPARTTTFSVQGLPTVTFSNLQPTRTKTGLGSARDFTATASKTGSQRVTLDRSVLTFGTNSCVASAKPSFAPGSNNQPVSFSCVADLVGTDGLLPASVTSTVVDDNDFVQAGLLSPLGNITVDNLAPLPTVNVVLPKDLDMDQQTATKNNDTLTITGTLRNAGDLATANPLTVTLQPDFGNPVPVTVAVTGTGEERAFTGTVATTWDPRATSFVAKVEARDQAGNAGPATSLPTTIDNVRPDLGGLEAVEQPGFVASANTIEVFYAELNGTRGGCNPNNWLIDGTPGQVTDVRDAAGTECTSGNGGRVLTLSMPLDVDETPRVTYDPLSRSVTPRPVKDGAGNDAVMDTVNTVTGLTPRLPNIVTVERRDSDSTAMPQAFEPAFLDTEEKAADRPGTYYSNVPGAQALRLTVGGIRQNYTVQVFKAGALVAEQKFTAAPLPLATEYNGSVLVPLAEGDGASDFTVRLLSAVGNAGPAAPFRVVLDRLVPSLRAATGIAGSEPGSITIVQPFSEKIAKGTDFSDDWFAGETVQTEQGPKERNVNVNSVAATDMMSRTFQATLANPAAFTRSHYFLQSGNGIRYEDRAGNTLASTLAPQA